MENNQRGGESSLCGEEHIESLKVNDKLDEEYRTVMKLNALNYPDIGNYPEKGRNIDLTRIYS